ncbi:ABC transporter substrate-binding protein [Novisyntrophococcus fermenticellae]|uniref:ABC transporter substrate-binding protein n=1 Tax=Novisyntrophococcus fermenticellae TaxID=2068655 RepID=UPI001E29C045|nr:extracellular solute-binding protein [Novisyntrophococcus fermenticellae]
MRKRTLAIAMTTVLVTGLAACGGAGTDTKEGSSSEKSDSGKEITLKVFDAHAYGLDEYADMAKKFEESHPGVKIEVQHAANDSNTLLQSRVNSGDIPDVFDVEAGTSAQKYYEYAYDWSNDKEVLDKFNEAALETGKDADGNIMSLPWTYENMGLIYNKDLFQKAGITELPKTMDELEEACEKLDAAGITAFSLAAKESWVLQQLSSHFMMDKSLDAKGVVEKLNSGDLKFKDMKNFQNVFKFLDLAVKYGPDKPLEVDWEKSENMLANGEAAIIHMGDWCQSTLDSFNPDANLGFLPCPVSDNPEDVTLLSSCNWTYLVNKDSEHLDLAKEYLEYILTSEEGLKWMTEGVGAVPGAKNTQEVKGALANDASVYVSEGKTNGWIHTIEPNGYADIVGPALQAYMSGDMTAEQVTEEFQNGWVVQ